MDKEKCIQEAKELDEQFKKTGQFYLVVKSAEKYKEAGEISLAEKQFKKIIGSGLEQLYLRFIDFYFDIKEYKKASNLLLSLYPNLSKKKRLAFADRLFECGAYDESIAWYSDCIDSFSTAKVYDFESSTKYIDDIKNLGFWDSKTIKKGDEYFDNRDYKNALHFYVKLLKKNIYAKVRCAECYYALEDFEKAKEIYRELIQATDNTDFMYYLANCYELGEITNTTYENTVYWLEYSIEKGCNRGYYSLGICYQFGRGVEQSLDKAKEYFLKASLYEYDKGSAFCKLGNIEYKNGNKEKAIEYYKEAIKLNDSRALVNIAICYFEDRIDVFSYEEIECYLYKAAALGNEKAKQMISDMKEI